MDGIEKIFLIYSSKYLILSFVLFLGILFLLYSEKYSKNQRSLLDKMFFWKRKNKNKTTPNPSKESYFQSQQLEEILEFLDKILIGQIHYSYDIVKPFLNRNEVDIIDKLEKIFEKYDLEKGITFLEKKTQYIDKIIKKELEKFEKAQKLAYIEKNISTNSPQKKESKRLSENRQVEVIIESNSKDISTSYDFIIHPVLINLFTGNERVREYCTLVIPYLNIPFKKEILLAKFLNRKETPKIRQYSIASLIKSFYLDTQLIKNLLSWVEDKSKDSREKAIIVRAFGEVRNEKLRNILVKLLKSVDKEVKMAAAYALGKMKEKSSVADLLETGIQDDDQDIFETISEALQKIDSPVVEEEIKKYFSNKVDNKIKKVILKLVHRLKLKNLADEVEKLLLNEKDIDLKIEALEILLDWETIKNLEKVLSVFQEIDNYLLEKAVTLKIEPPSYLEKIEGNNKREKDTFKFINKADKILDEEDILNAAEVALKKESKFIKATAILKLKRCSVSPRLISILKKALSDKDSYVIESATNIIIGKKIREMYPELEKLLLKKDISNSLITYILTFLLKEKYKISDSIRKKLRKIDDPAIINILENNQS